MARPGVATGLLVGLVLSPPLLAVLYVGSRLADLPFAPYDIFDRLARVLPGRLVTLGIDTLVALISLMRLGPTSAIAKAAEQAMALVLAMAGGTIGAAALFGLLRRRPGASSSAWGAMLGLAAGLIAWLAGSGAVTSTSQPLIGMLWTLGLFVGWGVMMGHVHARLSAAPLSVDPLTRRRFLIGLGAVSALTTVAGGGLGRLLSAPQPRQPSTEGDTALELPNATDPTKPAPGTRPEYTRLRDHYRIDINTFPPRVDIQRWRLEVAGLVDRPLSLSYDDLLAFEPAEQYVTLSCISNRVGGDLISTTKWTGVPVRRILEEARLQDAATQLLIIAEDGFDEALDVSLALEDERVMLAYKMDDQTLPAQHGFPLRIYIPDRYGMKQPKWIKRIEAIDRRHEGYWVRRGWDKDAIMRATSVVDSVATDMMLGDPAQPMVAVGGIAHAGARGISRVEVQVDGGQWAEATLRAPLSELTWVVWRYEWRFQAGRHTFRVRCIDGGGARQIEEPHGPRPSGATGIHVLTINL